MNNGIYRNQNAENSKRQQRLSPGSIALIAANLISFITVALTLTIPLYRIVKETYAVNLPYMPPSSEWQARRFIDILTGKSTDVGLLAGMIAFGLLTVLSAIFHASALKNLGKSEVRFARASSFCIYFDYAVTVCFFILGTVMTFFYREHFQVSSPSYIPFIICSFTAIFCSIARPASDPEAKKQRSVRLLPHRITILVFVLVFTLFALSSLFVDVVSISTEVKLFSSQTFSNHTSYNGMNLLKNSVTLEKGFQVLAYIEFLTLVGAGVLFVLALCSLISGSDRADLISKIAIGTNFISVFSLSMFGKYYEIAEKANRDTMLAFVDRLLSESGIGSFDLTGIFDDVCKIEIKSPLFFVTLAMCAAAALLLILKPFTKLARAESSALPGRFVPPGAPARVLQGGGDRPEPPVGAADPCPAFSALDQKTELFRSNLQKRLPFFASDITLAGIVDHVVTYARDSRLHLSYGREDIAAFIAGLGSTRLCILQGMSGTGKTSLPKIFCEAIFGNCELIEVESSWKDKSELIGYFNEFSGIFTPRKFTCALYKAAMNPEIITLIVLDEMNLSRVEYYFSDFLSLMENEPDKRELRLTEAPLFNRAEGETARYSMLTDGRILKIPPNVWFVGTANRDESTFEISDKVYDRAFTMNFTKRAPKARPSAGEVYPAFISDFLLGNLFEQAKNSMRFDIESSETVREVEKLLAPYNISFGNRVALQIEDFVRIYCACFPGSPDALSEGLETILLTKLVGKLEYRNIADKDELIRGFEELGLNRCAGYIKGMADDSFFA